MLALLGRSLLAATAVGCGRPQPSGGTPIAGEAVPPPAVSPTEAPAARPREITFDDVKLDMRKGDPFSRDLVPGRVVALDGQLVRIRGYILPSFQQSGLTQFVLVRDNQECCFGPGAALHDCVVVRMRPGRSTNFSIRPVAVAGVFRLEELRGPGGKHLAIYAMEGEAVE
ncbi:MAG: DUF3299 domain-containing protein [Planctomycetia bacterium]|nr:DUF3299 domain-containing protein [Planctomycetia bacterium]